MSSKYHKNRHEVKLLAKQKEAIPPEPYKDLFNIWEVFLLVLLFFSLAAWIARVF